MSHVIQAIYENGVLRPLEKLELGEHQRVRITVEPEAAEGSGLEPGLADPLDGVRAATGIADLAEHFDDYRLGHRKT